MEREREAVRRVHFAIVSLAPRLSYRSPFDTRKPSGALVRRLLLASIVLATLGAQHADGQIIRAPRFGAREPQLWVSGIVGLQQGFGLVDGTTNTRWDL